MRRLLGQSLNGLNRLAYFASARLLRCPGASSSAIRQHLLEYVSTECGEIPSSPNPGMSGDDTVSICISST